MQGFIVSIFEKTWVKESINTAIASIGQQKKTMEYTLLFDNFRTEPHLTILSFQNPIKQGRGTWEICPFCGAESEF
jgi:hypothetical protein